MPKFAPGHLLLKISNLNSIESEIDLKKFLFLGRLITEPNMSAVVKGLFRSRAASFFEADFTPIGVLPSICEALNKYDLFHYFQSWFLDSSFPSIAIGNQLLKLKFARGSHVNGINSALTTQACMLPRSAQQMSLQNSFGQ